MQLRKGSCLNRVVSAVVAVSIVCVPALASATTVPTIDTAEVSGSILAADGVTAIAGVVVKAANLQTRIIYTSATTDADGIYSLAGLPPGTYDMAVETNEGLFVSDRLIEAGAGRMTLVSFALQPPAPAEGDEEEGEGEADEGDQEDEGEGDESGDEGEPEPEPVPPPPSRGNFFTRPLGAALTILVGTGLTAAAANAATDDDTELDIPSMTPGGG